MRSSVLDSSLHIVDILAFFFLFLVTLVYMRPFQTSQTMFGYSTVSSECQKKNIKLVVDLSSPAVSLRILKKCILADALAIRSYTDPTCANIVSQYDGPLRTLHTMIVDPNGIIKKPGGKDLPVSRGEIVDVIQFINSKKALCCNQFGKCM